MNRNVHPPKTPGASPRRRSRRGGARRDARGSALIVALCATIPLLIAGGTLLVTVTQGRRATENSVALVQARDASASGAQDALARLAVDPNYVGNFQLQLGGPMADVTVTAWDGDGVDNDANGLVDDPAEEDFVEIVSTGTTNVAFDANGFEIERATRHARSVTDAIVRRTDLDLPANQALYVDDPLADFTFNGNAFLINGNDTNVDDTPGPNAPIPGIGTPGDPASIVAQLSNQQQDNVTGLGGFPSVGTTPDVDLPATMDYLATLATTVWDGPVDNVSGSIGDRANLVPVVAHAKGNLNLSGTTTGCGIIVVDGDLDIMGTFDYAGLIFVRGAVTIRGGGGTKDLHGGLATLGAVRGEDVEISGTIQLQYSSQAIAAVTQQISGGVTLVSWTQR